MYTDVCDMLPQCSVGICHEQQCLHGLCNHSRDDYSTLATNFTVLSPPFQLRIRSPIETIKLLKLLLLCERPAVFLRFGDGDLNLVEGLPDMMQRPHLELAHYMKTAFSLRGFNVIKTLPLQSEMFGVWPGMAPGVHMADDSGASSMASRALHWFVGEPVYATAALHHTIIYNYNLAISLLKLLKQRCPIFVGNVETPLLVRNALFGAGHVHVRTPASQAWEAASRVHGELRKYVADASSHPPPVIIFAAGCSGRAMAARLWTQNNNVYIFDFGSLLDFLSGQQTRQWIKERRTDINASKIFADMSKIPSMCK